MSEFEKRYMTINNTAKAPVCSPEVLEEFKTTVLSSAPSIEERILYPVLACIAIGSRRVDFVPHLFKFAIQNAHDEEALAQVYNRFSAAILVIWPSIGGPWCVPAQLSIAQVLKERGFQAYDLLSRRDPIGEQDVVSADSLLNNQYALTKDPNVQETLSKYCTDFDRVLRTVALGYCHAGVTKSGVLKEHEAELVLAASIVAAGATRSAIVHGKAALVLGNSREVVRATYEAALHFNEWNGTPITPVDVDELANLVGAA